MSTGVVDIPRHLAANQLITLQPWPKVQETFAFSTCQLPNFLGKDSQRTTAGMFAMGTEQHTMQRAIARQHDDLTSTKISSITQYIHIYIYNIHIYITVYTQQLDAIRNYSVDHSQAIMKHPDTSHAIALTQQGTRQTHQRLHVLISQASACMHGMPTAAQQ